MLKLTKSWLNVPKLFDIKLFTAFLRELTVLTFKSDDEVYYEYLKSLMDLEFTAVTFETMALTSEFIDVLASLLDFTTTFSDKYLQYFTRIGHVFNKNSKTIANLCTPGKRFVFHTSQRF